MERARKAVEAVPCPAPGMGDAVYRSLPAHGADTLIGGDGVHPGNTRYAKILPDAAAADAPPGKQEIQNKHNKASPYIVVQGGPIACPIPPCLMQSGTRMGGDAGY